MKTGVMVTSGGASGDRLVENEREHIKSYRQAGCLPKNPWIVFTGLGERHFEMKHLLDLKLVEKEVRLACFGKKDAVWVVTDKDLDAIWATISQAPNHFVVLTDNVVVQKMSKLSYGLGVFQVYVNGSARQILPIAEGDMIKSQYPFD